MNGLKQFAFIALLCTASSTPLLAQAEGAVATQALIRAEGKGGEQQLTAATTKLEVDGKQTALSSLTPVLPGNAQVALLIDDGLSRSAGIQLEDLRKFASTLPAGTELLVGYMSNGRVLVASAFTTDHAAAAKSIRLPNSLPGISASPYFCVSDFVKHWPGAAAERDLVGDVPADVQPAADSKARFIIMLSNGVDPYNGSVALSNQNSPYVDAAVTDAQRAGVAVYSIYYSDAGLRGSAASLSGQSYLLQLAENTGGASFYEGVGNPVSILPYFKQFDAAMLESYIATFPAEMGKRNKLVSLKVSSSVPKLKVRHPSAVRPGNVEVPQS